MTSISNVRGNATYTLCGYNGATLFTNSSSVNATRVITNSVTLNFTNICAGGTYCSVPCSQISSPSNIVVNSAGNNTGVIQVGLAIPQYNTLIGGCFGYTYPISNSPVSNNFCIQAQPVVSPYCTTYFYYPYVNNLSNQTGGNYASNFILTYSFTYPYVSLCNMSTACCPYLQNGPTAAIAQQFWMGPSDTLKICEYAACSCWGQCCCYGSGKSAGSVCATPRFATRNVAYSFTLVSE